MAAAYPIVLAQTAAGNVVDGDPARASLPADAWQPAPAHRVRLRDGDWLRISVAPIASAQPLYLVVPRSGTGSLTLHGPTLGSTQASDHYRGPFRADLSSHYHVFEIPDRLPDGATLYLQATGQVSRLSPELLVRDELFARDHAQSRLDTILRTLLLLMATINLLVCLLLRERVYGIYFAYVLASLASLAGHDASLYTVPLLAWWGALGANGILVLTSMSVVLLIAFARDFIRIAAHSTSIDRLLIVLEALFALAAALALFQVQGIREFVTRPIGIGYLLVPAALLLVASLAARGGRHYGWIFLFGFAPHGVTMMVQGLSQLGVIDSPESMYTAFLVSIAFEAMVCAIGLAYLAVRYRQERDAALELADRDELTRVFNRRALDRRLRQVCAMASDDELSGVAVLFIDLDHFKRINDTYGHAAGDECLREVARIIQSEMRQGDAVGRYGGEEFVAILPGTDRDDAVGIAERIRKRAQATTLSISGNSVRVHLSIGVAASARGVVDPERLLREADAAMYLAKSQGRNRVASPFVGDSDITETCS